MALLSFGVVSFSFECFEQKRKLRHLRQIFSVLDYASFAQQATWDANLQDLFAPLVEKRNFLEKVEKVVALR